MQQGWQICLHVGDYSAALLNDANKTPELRPRAKGNAFYPDHPSHRNASTNEERSSRDWALANPALAVAGGAGRHLSILVFC